MRLTTLLLLLAFPSSLWAQATQHPPDPLPSRPIIEQGITITEEIVLSRELTPPPAPVEKPTPPYARKLFWLGLGLGLTGAILTGLSVTTMRESDLSEENPNTRINVHLAPCGTEPDSTDLPIADCKTHKGLLYFGLGVTAAGAGLVWYSLDAAQPSPQFQYTVRF